MLEPPGPPEPPETTAPEPAAQAVESDGFSIGVWVELTTSGKRMRTQLTWCSPHNTLFLFTAPDGSTQSMTRRMRDKLVAGGALRVLDAQSTTERALRGAATSAPHDEPPLV
jgi:hypothetical protein